MFTKRERKKWKEKKKVRSGSTLVFTATRRNKNDPILSVDKTDYESLSFDGKEAGKKQRDEKSEREREKESRTHVKSLVARCSTSLSYCSKLQL